MLVVDDERPVRELIARWLQGAGFVCEAVGESRAAWESLSAHETALVTLDITMPGESGLELLGRIQERSPETAVVMVTALGEARTAIQALTQGASGYLVKPFLRSDLLFEVRRGLERRQRLIKRRRYTEGLEKTVCTQTQALRLAHEETSQRLVTASMYRDEETGAHCRRTGLFSEALARVAGWPADHVEWIRFAAPMHDVGKIGIPDAILRKPGKLTRDEFETMKTHTTIGARMLADSQSPVLQMAEEIARAHHEHWDGQGYPLALTGLFIPQAARIVSIVDVYDALTHDRVYRPALAESAAIQILREGRGSHFDPYLLDCFLGILPEIRRISRNSPDENAAEVEELLNAFLGEARPPREHVQRARRPLEAHAQVRP